MKLAEKSIDLLVVSPGLPAFDRNSGGQRLYMMLQAWSQRYRVSFVSLSTEADPQSARYAGALSGLGIEILSGQDTDPSELAARVRGAVVFEFFRTAERHLRRIRIRRPDLPILVDSVDLHFVREFRAAVYGSRPDLARRRASQTRRRELRVYGEADMVITVTDDDGAALLREAPTVTVRVVSNIHDLSLKVPPFAARRAASILFVGGFLHPPNADAVSMFCHEILPLVRQRLPDANLTVVGHNPPSEIVRLAQAGVCVTGWVPDVRPYVDSHRVAIAPLRFGAGMKGKIGEALAAGLPVVTTPIGAEGMGLEDGRTALIADSPASFAEAVVRLCTDAALHAHISAWGQDHVQRHWSRPVVERTLLVATDELLKMRPKRITLPSRLVVYAQNIHRISWVERNLDRLKWRAISYASRLRGKRRRTW